MFEVYDKETLKKVTIYAVGEDNHGYPKFLIRKDNRWIWRSAKHFITEEEKNEILLSLYTIVINNDGMFKRNNITGEYVPINIE